MKKENIYISGEYASSHPNYHVEDSPWKAKHILKIMENIPLEKVNAICEVGCGAGEILSQMQAKLPEHINFFGYDISPTAIELTASRENDRLKFYCKDLLEVGIEKPFDVMLCIDVVEHVDDYIGFLTGLKTKAKYKIFHIPLDMAMLSLVRSRTLVGSRKLLGHIHYFTKETAIAALEDAGYKIIDYTYTPVGIDQAKYLIQKLLILPGKILRIFDEGFAARVLGGFSLLVLTE